MTICFYVLVVCKFPAIKVSDFSNPPWEQRGLDIDGEAADDFSGGSVSMSDDGSVVAIGAHGNDGNGNDSGHVRVYAWDGTAWTQRGLDIDGEAADDSSGRSVSLSGDGSVVAIGGRNNDGNGNNSGHVRVYAWDGTAWTQRGLDIDGEAAGDNYGESVSLSGDGSVVATGGLFNDGNGNDSGHVRVFAWNGAAWTQRGLDIDGEAEFDMSGGSVSLSGDGSVVAIGAINNDGNGNNSGHVRVYAWNGTAWTQRGLDIDGEAPFDMSGRSVSLSGDGSVVAIGGRNNDDNGNNSGHVRVYAWDGTAWTQRGLDIDGEAAHNVSGGSVSLSGDGSVVAIGAHANSDNGYYSGHVRVYAWDGTAWTQRGLDIDGEAAGDISGGSVSLSGDGSVVAIGSSGNDGNGNDSGHVRVFAYGNGPNVPTATPTTAPSIIVESDHNYSPNTNQVWEVEIPNTTCYTVTMDRQSWTPHSGDVVQIFGVTVGGEGESNVWTRYPTTQWRLFKWRLPHFGTMSISADKIRVYFNTDGSKQAWGFKLYIEKCIGAE